MQQHNVDPKVIEKIQKMLRITEENATPGEVANALEKVSRFLTMHNLTLADIPTETSEEIYGYVVAEVGRSRWRRGLIYQLALFNFCDTVYIHNGRMALIGSNVNRQAVQAMYATAEEQLVRLARKAWVYYGKGNPRHWMDGFYTGAVSAIAERLKEAQERMLTVVPPPPPAPEAYREDVFIPRPTPEYDEEPGQAGPAPEQIRDLLVLTDARLQASVKKHFPKLKQSRRKPPVLRTAYEHGMQAGKNITLAAGLLEGAQQ